MVRAGTHAPGNIVGLGDADPPTVVTHGVAQHPCRSMTSDGVYQGEGAAVVGSASSSEAAATNASNA